MSLFLSVVSERHPDEIILMFMDQALAQSKRSSFPQHTTSQRAAYSPELNPRNTFGRNPGKVVPKLVLKVLPP